MSVLWYQFQALKRSEGVRATTTRTAGGKDVGAKGPKAAGHGSTGKKAVGRGDSAAAGQLNSIRRSPFSFDHTPADSDVVGNNSRAARRKSTIHQFDMYIKRLEWLLKYHGGWPTKTNNLGVSVLETAHAALSSWYGQQLIRKGGSQADFCPPKLIKSLGGKAQNNGKKGFLEQAPYPDRKDAEAWNKQPLWPAALGSASNLSYDQQYKALIEIMKKLGICTVKVTHTHGGLLVHKQWMQLELTTQSFAAQETGCMTQQELPGVIQGCWPPWCWRLARVVIQDAAGGLSRVHPHHDVHVLLNTSSVFRFVEE
ncbi:hypothetical protein WJX77_011787 [Trebouxia sp. C0004]